MIRHLAVAAALAALALAASFPPPARACGGVFCSAPRGPVPPEPVDQSAERIIFDVHGNGTITAHVQIQYAGGASSFAWVVPVPSVAIVEESEVAYFEALDAATAPTVTLPLPEPCPTPTAGNECGFGGCGDSGANASLNGTPRDGESPVTVYAHDFTDNYEYVVLGAEQTSDLVSWLGTNGYNVSDNMTPVMSVYNTAGMKFLAIKLRDGKDTRDIVPIAFTYEGTEPMVPIRLTAVAAQPLMGILVFIVGDDPYKPKNYDAPYLDDEDLAFDANGATNYFEVVARTASERGGHYWSPEFVGDLPSVPPSNQPGTVSRYYTRLSPEDMDLDPIFVADVTLPEHTSNFDFSARTTLWRCGATVIADRLPSPCAFTFCGRGAQCTVTAGAAGCLCPVDHVAQQITGPDGNDRVTCVPKSNPYAVTDAAGGAGTTFDPCLDYPCGAAGRCALRGGFPTCQCDVGAVANLSGAGLVTCTMPTGALTTFGPGAGAESAGLTLPFVGQRTQVAVPWLFPLVGLLFSVVWMMTRRREYC